MASFNLTAPKLISGLTSQYPASEAITAGDCVWYDPAGGTVSKTESNETLEYVAVGIALMDTDVNGQCVLATEGAVIWSSTLAAQITDTSTTFWVQRGGDIAVYADVAASDYLCRVGIPWTANANMLIKILDYAGETKS